MILSVTPNPALDRTLVARDFARGGVFRTQENLTAAGGKGINVARAVQTLGGDARCAGFLGGFSGQSVAALVGEMGLDARWTWLPGRETRTCVILVDPDTGLVSVVNEPGPTVTADDWERLRADLLQAAAGVSLVSFSGSLPPGSPVEQYAALLAGLVAAGKTVWVDTSRAALAAAAGVRGVAIKVNDEEAAALVHTSIANPMDAAGAAHRIASMTGQPVAITLGAAGAVLAASGDAWHAIPPAITSRSGVGSGDSFLGALLGALADGASLADALAQGTAAGTANALSLGAACFTRPEFDRVAGAVRVTKL